MHDYDLSATVKILAWRENALAAAAARANRTKKFVRRRRGEGSNWRNPSQARTDRLKSEAFSGGSTSRARPIWGTRGGEPAAAGRDNADAKTLSRLHPTCGNADRRQSGMPNERRRENVKSESSDLLRRRSARAAKAQLGFVAGACDKRELRASTEDAPSSDGRITPASRQTSKRAHRSLRRALWS